MFWYDDTPVYIYGAGLKGKLIYELLVNLGCNVCGFLDRASENIHLSQCVFQPDKLSKEQRKNSIVICSVANVFEHRKIAANLVQQGYVYIIYKGINGNADGNKEIIDIIWDMIEEVGRYSLAEIKNFIIGREVFAYRDIGEKEVYEINVREKNGYVDVAVPAIFLYTFPKDLYISFHKRQDWLRIPYERNVYYYLYCADLFRMFENGAVSGQEWEETIEVYKRYFANADVYIEKDLEVKFRQHMSQRYSIYNEMNKLFHANCGFFEEYPLFVKWNETRHCLYVRDGNNRLGFLLSKGIHNVMCRMAQEDYAQWANGQEMQKLILSTTNEQAGARMALKWMGKMDILEKVNRVLFLSSNPILCDVCSKMGVDAVVYEESIESVAQYQKVIDVLGERKYRAIQKMKSLEEFDLIWFNLSSISEQIEKDKIIQLLSKYSKFVVLEGNKEDVREIINRIHGEIVKPTYIYWNNDKEVTLNLVRKVSLNE